MFNSKLLKLNDISYENKVLLDWMKEKKIAGIIPTASLFFRVQTRTQNNSAFLTTTEAFCSLHTGIFSSVTEKRKVTDDLMRITS